MTSTHVLTIADNLGLSEAPEACVDFVCTSPPYVTTTFERGQAFPYDSFIDYLQEVFAAVYWVLKPGCSFALNVADILTKYRYKESSGMSRASLGCDALTAAQNAGFRLFERFIWDKGFTRNFGGPLLGSYPYPGSLYNNTYWEYLWILKKPGQRRVPQELRMRSRLSIDEWRAYSQKFWRVESVSEKIPFHGAVFPIEIPRRLIKMFSFVGDIVLDPFSGTGATAIAAQQGMRRSISIDNNPACLEMMAERISLEYLNGNGNNFVISQSEDIKSAFSCLL